MNLKSQLQYVLVKIKYVFSNLFNGNAYYYLKGHLLYKIHGKAILTVLRRQKECKICFDRIYCVECGCETIPLFLSGKKCKTNGLATNRNRSR